LKEWDAAEKFLKKEIKSSDGDVKYIAEYGRLLEMLEKKEDATKQYTLAVDKAKLDDNALIGLLNDLIENGQYDLAIKAIEESRVATKDAGKMTLEMAKLYRRVGKRAEMIEEYLRYGLMTENLESVEMMFQDELKEDSDIELFEKILYADIQKYPEQPYFSQLLSWHLIQKKEFNRAFVQLKALDRRYKKEGLEVSRLGDLAYQNKDFQSAGKIFEYLVKEYPKNVYYPVWRRMLITSKEELIKTVYPVNLADIRVLINEYSKMLGELGINQRTLDGLRNQGLLYAFYLNEKDTAITVLNKAIANAQGDQQFIDRCKLDLGDIYVLKTEPWEATLLYSQVEKSEKDSPLGYDAKLRNAKLAYFRGDFELAREVLDILKQATTREIANDAMDLSLLILENTGEDSTEAGMKSYAAIELLLFQHRDAEALAAMDKMLKTLKGNSLEDNG
jgi:lipopolysaccharide biosynthesis regulator YciM